MTPFPVILSAPSGAGKTTIARRVLEARADVAYSISATTRARRSHELDGRDYHFLSEDDFTRRRRAGEFAEFAEVHGRWYGTLRSEVESAMRAGRHVIMDIDVQGARAFRRVFGNSVLVFILPPSVDVLVTRLRARNTESDESIDRRLRTALTEVEAVTEYDYVVINDQLDAATSRVSAIIDAEAARRTRSHGVEEKVAAILGELRQRLSANV